ncbi:MAG: hypothetical protein WAO35_26905 [Terriglobia bacterium]
MNKIRISTLVRFLGLALLAACFNAGPASAQVFQGKFTLPFAARWGQTTLPAGDYSFTLDSANANCTVRLYNENGGVAMVLAQVQDKSDAGRAALTVVRGTVRALSLPEIGIILQYAPQRPKHLTAAEEREISQVVPITASGKYNAAI